MIVQVFDYALFADVKHHLFCSYTSYQYNQQLLLGNFRNHNTKMRSKSHDNNISPWSYYKGSEQTADKTMFPINFSSPSQPNQLHLQDHPSKKKSKPTKNIANKKQNKKQQLPQLKYVESVVEEMNRFDEKLEKLKRQFEKQKSKIEMSEISEGPVYAFQNNVVHLSLEQGNSRFQPVGRNAYQISKLRMQTDNLRIQTVILKIIRNAIKNDVQKEISANNIENFNMMFPIISSRRKSIPLSFVLGEGQTDQFSQALISNKRLQHLKKQKKLQQLINNNGSLSRRDLINILANNEKSLFQHK